MPHPFSRNLDISSEILGFLVAGASHSKPRDGGRGLKHHYSIGRNQGSNVERHEL